MNRLRKTINMCVNCYDSKPQFLNNHLNKIIYTLVDGPFKISEAFRSKGELGATSPHLMTQRSTLLRGRVKKREEY